MMKRLIALCLALLLLFSATALADWAEGLGPNKPYNNVREVDFEQTLGYMIFYPNGITPETYTKTLFIYLPRDDISINRENGATVTVRSSNPDVETVTVALSDPDAVRIRALVNSELEGLMWGCGTCIEIELPTSLRLDCTYYVDLSDRAIMDEAREIGNDAFTSDDSTNWHFTLLADYGVSELAYLNAAQQPVYKPAAGDTVRFDLVLGGAAKSATLAPQGMITFDVANPTITESCEITATIEEDFPRWQIIFWDVETPPTDINALNEHIVSVLEF